MAWDKKIAARTDELMALTQVGGSEGLMEACLFIPTYCLSPLSLDHSFLGF